MAHEAHVWERLYLAPSRLCKRAGFLGMFQDQDQVSGVLLTTLPMYWAVDSHMYFCLLRVFSLETSSFSALGTTVHGIRRLLGFGGTVLVTRHQWEN